MHPIHIGACGWAYPGWVGPFYRAGLKQADFLQSYAQRLPIVEVDSTFYRPPTISTINAWRHKTPDNFRLCLKVPQTITHEKMLTDCSAEADQFHNAVRGLGEKLRCCVLQFPYLNRKAFPSIETFLARLDPFLSEWPADIPVAVEVRNAKWITPALGDCLRAHRAAWVLADIVRMPSPTEVVQQIDSVTSSFAYIRLIGHRADVEQHTQTFDRIVVDRSERIAAVAEAIRLLAKQVPVLVFVNNHFAGYAPETIRQLQAALGIANDAGDANWFFGGIA